MDQLVPVVYLRINQLQIMSWKKHLEKEEDHPDHVLYVCLFHSCCRIEMSRRSNECQATTN